MTPRFVNTGTGRLVNVDRIASIRFKEEYPPGGRPYVKEITFELVDGSEIGPLAGGGSLIDSLAEELVPAAPGYHALSMGQFGPDGRWEPDAPIIAWAISRGVYLSGVPAEADDIFSGCPGRRASLIVLPNKRVVNLATSQTWSSPDAWFAQQQARRREHHGVA